MVVLIPAYEPDLRLLKLVTALLAADAHPTVLVVDDGSGPGFDGVFGVVEDAGAHVLRLPHNRGKGAALKSGFAWVVEHRPGDAVVCADCDGQHTPEDILRIATRTCPGTLVLGGRRFNGDVPARSRVGNTVSRWLFRAATGTRVHDTQTGLRAYPHDLLGWLGSVEGERFEYEFNQLLGARDAGVAIREVEIATIYLADNASSHFRPLRDSLRIYAPMLRFAASSLTSYALDLALVVGVQAATGHLLLAVVVARLVSGTYNFHVNRTFVFRHPGDPANTAFRYATLAVGLLAANYTLLSWLVGWGWPLAPAKVAVEALLVAISFVVQRRAVFGGGQRSSASLTGSPNPGITESRTPAA